MENGFAPAFLPLKRYAQFSGRATRTELAFFYLLVAALNMGLEAFGDLIGHRAEQFLSLLLMLAIACPTLALFVRRLHDSGRSGCWVLLGLPGFGFALWHAWLKLRDPHAMSPLNDFPFALGLGVAVLAVFFVILLLWDDQDEANCYGPNPRYEGQGEPA